jgi:Tol biopolymer transport system component
MLHAGTRLGPYEIAALVGEGGMGQVYKARDTRLDRVVAIKMLPANVAADSARRERFEREARSISRLEHPHICSLYDIGEHEGHLYLVMQFLDGETLADRLQRGALPISQVLDYGIQIADALATAHRAGIVHRDLKPGNVMVTRAGAHLLDFGLARTVALPSSAHTTDTRPLVPHSTLTSDGTILGTLYYMAPEQIDGREIDTRADVFAFGAVLFEMVTGLKPFDGESPARVMSAILRDEPTRVSSIAPVTPAALDALIHACLAKDPNDRWQNIADVARQLRHLRGMLTSGSSQVLSGSGVIAATSDARARWPARAGWITAGLLAVALGAVTMVRFWPAPTPSAQPVTLHALILPPDGMYLTNALALSPDGTRLAFVAADATGVRRLWMRPLDRPLAQVLTSTEGASDPFWAPDGTELAFFAGGQLKRVAPGGGAVTVICEAGAGAGGTWNEEGVIVFSPLNGPLMRVAAAGGTPEPLTTLDRARQDTHHLYPTFLPGGKHLIFYVAGRERGLYVQSMESRELTRLFDPDPALPPGAAATASAYAASGHLLYVRDRVLTARRFDLDRLETVGEPFTVAETVDFDPPGQAAFTTAAGMLIYRARQHRPVAALGWVDRTGQPVGAIEMPPGTFRKVSLSPNGRTIAIDRRDAQGLPSVWLVDVGSGTSTRLPSTYWSADPQWSVDGQRLAYSIAADTPPNLVTRDQAGQGPERRLLRSSSDQQHATSWTPDGRSLVYEVLSGATGWDLQMVSTTDENPTPQRLLQTRANETTGRVSPDGRWIAYVSDQSGQAEVYVARFPEIQGERKVSSNGGSRPSWRRDGRELFYLGSEGRVIALSLTPGTALEIGSPTELFRMVLYGNIYVPDGSGQRFLVARPVPGQEPVPLEIILKSM